MPRYEVPTSRGRAFPPRENPVFTTADPAQKDLWTVGRDGFPYRHFEGDLVHRGTLFLGNDDEQNESTPAQLTANTDNYAPTDIQKMTVLRLDTDAARNLTGIEAPDNIIDQYSPNGRMLLLHNIGSNDMTLVHDATSTAANRFFCPGSVNFLLITNASVWIRYDSTSSRWRVLGEQTADIVQTVTATPVTAAGSNILLIDDDTVGGAVVVNLPAAADSTRMYHIKKLGTAGIVTVDGSGSETIDGATTAVLTVQFESISIVSDGSNWHVI